MFEPDDIQLDRAEDLGNDPTQAFYQDWDGSNDPAAGELPQGLIPCGYCRRCAIHDDPGGCLEVERYERENPAIAAMFRVF